MRSAQASADASTVEAPLFPSSCHLGKPDVRAVMEVLSAKKGEAEDRLRLALMLLLTSKQPLGAQEIDAMENTLFDCK